MSERMDQFDSLIAANEYKTLLKVLLYGTGTSIIGYIVYKMLMWSYHKNEDLNGKLVLITGASGGLGKELGCQFLERGCIVILTGRNLDRLNIAREDILKRCHLEDGSSRIATYEMDTGDIERLPAAVDGLADFAASSLNIKTFAVDILVNNAGVGQRTDFLETSMSAHNKIFDVNYFGPVFLTQLLMPHLLESHRPTIVNICSLQSWVSMPGRCAYSASKFALRAFGDSLRNEMGNRLRVLSVYPGYIATNHDLNALRKEQSPTTQTAQPTSHSNKVLSSVEVAQSIIRSLERSGDMDLMIYNDIFQRIAVLMTYACPKVVHKYLLRKHQKTQ